MFLNLNLFALAADCLLCDRFACRCMKTLVDQGDTFEGGSPVSDDGRGLKRSMVTGCPFAQARDRPSAMTGAD
jgi:hypothetical protein